MIGLQEPIVQAKLNSQSIRIHHTLAGLASTMASAWVKCGMDTDCSSALIVIASRSCSSASGIKTNPNQARRQRQLKANGRCMMGHLVKGVYLMEKESWKMKMGASMKEDSRMGICKGMAIIYGQMEEATKENGRTIGKMDQEDSYSQMAIIKKANR
ncbi:hypothetical protein FGO68_gene12177 [Halteria grandinella]|uniref:Uncharacterized protein n=1 Tax=Halteria grandinella TaxID=5974 RepID=A0A8J8NTT1_HALGN|nr:hypothetical protein FGO68_gene12177 [Halteria grandinella]